MGTELLLGHEGSQVELKQLPILAEQDELAEGADGLLAAARQLHVRVHSRDMAVASGVGGDELYPILVGQVDYSKEMEVFLTGGDGE